MGKSNLKMKINPLGIAVLAVVNSVTVQNVIDAYKLASDSEGKATDTFRSYIGFPAATALHMEEKWVAFNVHFAELPLNKQDAVKKLMSECRQTCAKPFTVGKDKARTIRDLTVTEIATIAERKIKVPKGAKTPTGAVTHTISDVEPVAPELSDVAVLDRFYALALNFLKADDLTIAERLVHAIKYAIDHPGKKTATK